MPRKPTPKKAKSGSRLNPRYRERFLDDEADEEGRGMIEKGLPGYGVWRRVPGFWPVLASDRGFIMTMGAKRVRKQWQRETFYMSVRCNERREQVHNLVCRAFHGPALPHHASVDHMGDKTLPMSVRRANNNAENLRLSLIHISEPTRPY